ncbi:MAG: S1C family serine protease [Akkermansiaceae bacterium]
MKMKSMITKTPSARSAASGLSFGSLAALALAALSVPALAVPKPAADEAGANGGKENAPKEKANKAAKADPAAKPAKKFAMLGVAGAAASETLSLHLGLDHGNGLTLLRVVPGTGAEKAGLAVHDIITEIDGKKIGIQQDVRDVIGEHKPGDKVTVKYISKGKAAEVEVTLGERTARHRRNRGNGANPNGLPFNFQGLGDMPQIDEEDMKRMQEQLRKHVEQLRKQLGDGGGDALPFIIPGMVNPQPGAPQGKKGQGGMKQLRMLNLGNVGAEITLMDKKGSVTMKSNNGKKEIIVKDKAGKTTFEGPYETEQDKAAVPDDIRERVEGLNFGMMNNGKGGLELRLGPGGIMPPPPAPAEPKEDVPEG